LATSAEEQLACVTRPGIQEKKLGREVERESRDMGEDDGEDHGYHHDVVRIAQEIKSGQR
jgi:hypothetical protein